MKNNQALKGSPSKKILYFYEMDGGYKVGEYIASYDVISQFRGRMVGGRRKGGERNCPRITTPPCDCDDPNCPSQGSTVIQRTRPEQSKGPLQSSISHPLHTYPEGCGYMLRLPGSYQNGTQIRIRPSRIIQIRIRPPKNHDPNPNWAKT